ncbi:carbohydrate binding domain-containing protein [uncultured Polaribacter sp.]|uniref:carbohydrate binding domain-containing protein n=1 Tax=uncultured Polaribacter sp. TaxID=174711 RepID=UPI0026308E73|nr:carbohydrate binding domain-containing protein [uncultured Polaribacter sp.]
MKKNKILFKIIIALLVFGACKDNVRDLDFLTSIQPPSEVTAAYNITQDNTGLVTITPTADGASEIQVFFDDGTGESETLTNGQSVQRVYTEGTFSIKLVASNTVGGVTEATQQLIVSFNAPQNLVVVIENDESVSKKVNVTANAEFATMYDFYSGETGADPISGNIGETISFQYQEAGTYAVRVVAKGAAIETTEFSDSFEVEEILDPTMAAPTPPSRNADDVISLFSNVYTDVNVDTWNTSWSQASFEDVIINNNATKKYTSLNFNGIETIASPVDASSMTHIHLDIWTPNMTEFKLKLVDFLGDGSGGANTEAELSFVPTLGEWVSLDIELTNFTDAGMTALSDLNQYIISGNPSGSGIIFVDNVYFYRPSSASTFNSGLLKNGDFESGSESWIVGVDDNTPVSVVTNAGNTYYSANVTNPNSSEPYLVNASQKLEIIDGNTYTLTFDAWSDRDRSIIGGIGLSGGNFANNSEPVNITSARTKYSLTLLADGFGATDARVLFDLAGEAGLVNIDNVSLLIGTGNIVINGDFQNGNASWIVGVDDNAPASVVSDGGNIYYSANVTNANSAEPYRINVSQKLEIIDGETYSLTFDAWSDRDRSILAGIGLSGGSFANTNESVNITATRTTYMVTLLADGFGETDARVLFDLAAELGLVNIDNVTLSKI